jgi:hypothetical protein
LSEEQFALRQMLERREREFLFGKEKVKMRTSVENLALGGSTIEKLNEGETVELPRWIGDELVGMNLAESGEEPFEAQIFRALSKEKMMGPLQLSSLPGDFYQRMKSRVNLLGRASEAGRVKKEEVDRLRIGCYDLVGIRLSKLLALSSSATSSSSLEDRLTPEESAFFSVSQGLSKEWRAALLGGGK